mgnify:CR=1 FL=1
MLPIVFILSIANRISLLSYPTVLTLMYTQDVCPFLYYQKMDKTSCTFCTSKGTRKDRSDDIFVYKPSVQEVVTQFIK